MIDMTANEIDVWNKYVSYTLKLAEKHGKAVYASSGELGHMTRLFNAWVRLVGSERADNMLMNGLTDDRLYVAEDTIRPDADGNYNVDTVCSYCHKETCEVGCDNYIAPAAMFDSKKKQVTVYIGGGAQEIVYGDIVSFTEIENVIKQHIIHWHDVTWKISQREYRYYHQFLYNYQFNRCCYHCDSNNKTYVGDECHTCFYADCVKLLSELGL